MVPSVSHTPDAQRVGQAFGLDHRKLGMWLFLASEVMFFGGLIAAFLHYKVNLPTLEVEHLSVPLVAANTFVLLTSSFTVVLGLAAAQAGQRRGLAGFLGLTLLLGLVFLGGQAFEFATLYREGVTLTGSVFGSSFFTLTGFHGLHVLVGVLWCARVLRKALAGAYDAGRWQGVELFGLYWHFVDIVWIVLFTIIYLV